MHISPSRGSAHSYGPATFAPREPIALHSNCLNCVSLNTHSAPATAVAKFFESVANKHHRPAYIPSSMGGVGCDAKKQVIASFPLKSFLDSRGLGEGPQQGKQCHATLAPTPPPMASKRTLSRLLECDLFLLTRTPIPEQRGLSSFLSSDPLSKLVGGAGGIRSCAIHSGDPCNCQTVREEPQACLSGSEDPLQSFPMDWTLGLEKDFLGRLLEGYSPPFSQNGRPPKLRALSSGPTIRSFAKDAPLKGLQMRFVFFSAQARAGRYPDRRGGLPDSQNSTSSTTCESTRARRQSLFQNL